MNFSASTLLILLLFSLLIALIWLYNRMVRMRNQVDEAWAGIDVQLQKRHELVPNLVQTVKGYVRHESGVFERVAQLRSNADHDVTQQGQHETKLSHELIRLFALAEDYPDLKANEGFQQLHQSLADIEDQLQYARRYYNGAVRLNNNAVESFPGNLVAAVFGFRSAAFFEIELASQRSVPEVVLSS